MSAASAAKLTKQLAILFQQSNNSLLAKSFTTANDLRLGPFLSLLPRDAIRRLSNLQQLKAPQDENSLQIEYGIQPLARFDSARRRCSTVA